MKARVVAVHSASVWTDGQPRYDLRLEGCLSSSTTLRLSQAELGFPVKVDDELEITIHHPADCFCCECIPSKKDEPIAPPYPPGILRGPASTWTQEQEAKAEARPGTPGR